MRPGKLIRTKERTPLTLLLVAVLLPGVLGPIDARAQECPVVVWSDEFDGTSLDSDKWTPQIGDGCPGLCGWGNNELQYYRAENATVSDGTLKITARDEAFGGRQYTSARIRTLGKGEWTFGRFEARIKLPYGQGIWPAFWMMPTDEVYGGWPMSGEIDIMEMVGHQPDVIHGTIHFGDAWPNNRHTGASWRLPEGTYSDDFHVFAVEREPGLIRWYVDDVLYGFRNASHTAPHEWPFDERFHFILNVAVGGNWPGNPDATTQFPQVMEVDYVRACAFDSSAVSTQAPARDLPESHSLGQNYPNPFHSWTELSYRLVRPVHVTLRVYNLLGEHVATLVDGLQESGDHLARFDAVGLPGGVYVFRLDAGGYQEVRKMTLLR